MRLVVELALFAVIGIFLGITGAYNTAPEPLIAKLAFWIAVVVAGGAFGILVDTVLVRWVANPWWRAVAAALIMTPAISLLVTGAMVVVLRHQHEVTYAFGGLLWQVLVISLAVMTLRALVHRPPKRIVETQTVIAPPLDDADAAFRTRLSARRRSAKLIALEAQDHFVRVHTDAGIELLSIRLSDAVAELTGVHGFRVHRSWWVAGEAIKAAKWRRASGELTLEGDLVVPISRSGAPALRAAGWL
jgi:DNA-binding LytR/AlgR family response regulator